MCLCVKVGNTQEAQPLCLHVSYILISFVFQELNQGVGGNIMKEKETLKKKKIENHL